MAGTFSGAVSGTTGTWSSTDTATAFIPTGSTVPTNGIYLSAANTLAFASNTTLRGSVNSTGNWVLAAPSSGVALTVSAVAGQVAATFSSANQGISITSSAATAPLKFVPTGQDAWTIGAGGVSVNDFAIQNATRSTNPITISGGASGGNVTINAPSSGVALTVNGVTAQMALSISSVANYAQSKWNDGTVDAYLGVGAFANTSFNLGTLSAHAMSLYTNGNPRIALASAGNVTINAPSSGDALTVNQLTGAYGAIVKNGAAGSAILELCGNGSSPGGNTVALFSNGADNVGYLSVRGNFGFNLQTNATTRVAVAAAGNVTINAPSSGTTLELSTVGGTGTGITIDSKVVRTGLVGTTTIDIGSIAAGALTTTNITVTGASVGDPVDVGASTSAAGLMPYAQVTSADTVSVGFQNCTTGALDPANTVFKVFVWKS